MSDDKPINWVDQIAHGGIACFIVALSGVPVISGIVGALRFAVTREYYQGKSTAEAVYRVNKIKSKPSFIAVMKEMNWTKRDLVAAYAGILVGIPAALVVYWQLFLWVKTWL